MSGAGPKEEQHDMYSPDVVSAACGKRCYLCLRSGMDEGTCKAVPRREMGKGQVTGEGEVKGNGEGMRKRKS